MFQFPGPIRATVGLIATATDNLRKSPEKLIEIPMLALSSALQASIRTQQRYAQFTVRGDEVLGRMRPIPDTAPTWATFDDEIALPAKPSRAKSGRIGRTPARDEIQLDEIQLDEIQLDEIQLDEIQGDGPEEPANKAAGKTA